MAENRLVLLGIRFRLGESPDRERFVAREEVRKRAQTESVIPVGFARVGLRGYKLNPALQRYLAAGPPVQEARGRPCQRRPHRIAKRLPAESIQTLVAEYVAGAPAAELGRRYGLAKTTVFTLLRAADVRVRHARLSAADVARIVELPQSWCRLACLGAS